MPKVTLKQPVAPESTFFEVYDNTFFNSNFIQECLRSRSLVIAGNFEDHSRFDDFAEEEMVD